MKGVLHLALEGNKSVPVESFVSPLFVGLRMQSNNGIQLSDVQAVYRGPEGDLWELLMGQQIHLGGIQSSMGLAEAASGVVGPRLPKIVKFMTKIKEINDGRLVP